MSLTILLAFLVALIGIVLYFVSKNEKVMQVGIVSYGVGFLAGLLQMTGHVLHIGSP